MNKCTGQMLYDQNNNEEVVCKLSSMYVERHLELGEDENFLIIPNGGSGDCMFKAVSQAVFNGDESRHKEIRLEVVDFIISHRWEKFSEFIEVQHINGNSLLQRQWHKDPQQTYRMYMSLAGTLGSSSELTAAAELFRYNFATIQEYCQSSQRTYRVENCVLFDMEKADFHYFYFTGDFDNGHWEFLKSLSNARTNDGTYHGCHKTVIEGEEISIETWLQRETENNNSADHLKILTDRSLFTRRSSPFPFELVNCFRFEKNGTVMINGTSFAIENVEYTDLFSVLAHECLQNQGSAHETELSLIKHRYSYFEEINYKLITQPLSHNFTTEAVKYCSYSCKGNIQDLICAADLYSFSFILFIKLQDTGKESGEDVHQCKFTHVDRWGGENERVLFFFMHLSPVISYNGLIAKWWLLTPHAGKSSYHQIHGQPRHSLGKIARPIANISRPVTRNTMQMATPSTLTSDSSTHLQLVPEGPCTPPEYEDDIIELDDTPSEIASLARMSMTTSGESLKISGGLRKDLENIFGSENELPEVPKKKSSLTRKSEQKLVKKCIKDKIKLATGKDLARHPEKVKTVVKLKDKSNSGREITYRGKGYIKADDVLNDLKSKGLIKQAFMGQPNPEFSFDKIFKTNSDTLKASSFAARDENFNFVQEGAGKPLDGETGYGNKPNETSVMGDVQKKDSTCSESRFMVPPTHRRFSKTLLSYLKKDQINVKRNKVSPNKNPVEGEGDKEAPRESCRVRFDEETYTRRPCVIGLLQILGRIVARFRKISEVIKRGFRSRYERYQTSSSMFSFPTQAKAQQGSG